jgi:putative transposase
VLARKAKAVGRKALLELDTLVSPDTLMRWHRRLAAQKWDFSERRGPGRPGIMREISRLIVRMERENPGWGYTRIQGALANLNHKVGRGTISNVLKRNGIEPAPERSKRTTWSTFLRAHWKVFAASDFFSVEVWTPKGLLTHYVLFVISMAERAVYIAGITTRPDEAWMLQMGRNLIDEEGGALALKRYLIIDRDTKYTRQFRRARGAEWDGGYSSAADVAELERLCGTVRSLDQKRMRDTDDLHRAGVVTPCCDRIRRALSQRTQPPRT